MVLTSGLGLSLEKGAIGGKKIGLSLLERSVRVRTLFSVSSVDSSVALTLDTSRAPQYSHMLWGRFCSGCTRRPIKVVIS